MTPDPTAYVGFDPDKEGALAHNFLRADLVMKEEVCKLWQTRRKTSHQFELLYLTAHAFTEDTKLWAYANMRLDALRNWFSFGSK